MANITAPMVGKIIQMLVSPGDVVEEGQEVFILEAMKMEMPVAAETSGTVKEVKAGEGQTVEADAVVVVLA
jgi:acetyl-CoA carboxylase biotin carboxyl carrier protein